MDLITYFMMDTAYYTSRVLFATFQKRFQSYHFIFGKNGFLQVSSIHLLNGLFYSATRVLTTTWVEQKKGLLISFSGVIILLTFSGRPAVAAYA